MRFKSRIKDITRNRQWADIGCHFINLCGHTLAFPALSRAPWDSSPQHINPAVHTKPLCLKVWRRYAQVDPYDNSISLFQGTPDHAQAAKEQYMDVYWLAPTSQECYSVDRPSVTNMIVNALDGDTIQWEKKGMLTWYDLFKGNVRVVITGWDRDEKSVHNISDGGFL